MKREYFVELPDTDALRVFSTIRKAFEFIESLGVTEFHYKNGKFVIPEFAAGREEYSRLKQIECDRWGCE